MATAEMLMTAEEFGRRPDPGHPEELVRGRIVAMSTPVRRDGLVRLRSGQVLVAFVGEHDIGQVVSDAEVITGRDPDTVRRADIAFYSYARLPRGRLSPVFGPEIPELAIAVRHAGGPWRDILRRVAEFLMAGVLKVVVLNSESRKAHVFDDEEGLAALGPEEDLTFPGLLEGFRVAVHRFFD